LMHDASALQNLGANGFGLGSAGRRTDDAQAAARLAVAGDGRQRAFKQAFGDRPRGRLLERLADISQLLALIEIERLAEELLLVAEGGVEARACDAHRLGQVR